MKKIYKVTLGLLISFALLLLYVNFALHRPNSDGSESKFVRIERGAGLSEIGGVLEGAELINSKVLFISYVKLKGIVLEAGSYDIPPNLSVIEIAELLRSGRDDVKVTIVEGLRREEVAELLSENLKDVSSEEFLEKTRDLEGTLFPDTYFFRSDETTDGAIEILTDTFKSKTAGILLKNDGMLTEREVIILASLVEREEPDPLERPTVAGILAGRFERGEVLGVDATVQYAIGRKGDWWPKSLTKEDLDVESPFNTRKHAGLPPAPISSPGLSALQAVVERKATDYRYYLHDKNGKVHYAKTMEEHLENISKYGVR